MRILIALNYYHPYISGLSESVRLLAEGLARRGCAVTVLAGRHDPALPLEETRKGVRIVRAGVLFKLHKGYLSLALIRMFRQLAHDAEVVHLNTPMLEAGLLAAMVSGQRPLVVSHHCDIVTQNSSSFVETAGFAVVRFSARTAFRRADAISVSSDDYAQGSPDVRPFLEKCTAIPPPDNAPKEPVAIRQPGKRVGFLGRFVPEKGIGVLLEAIPLVLRRIPDARFILAGNHSAVAGGSQYDVLKPQLELLRDHVEVPGIIPDDELAAFYRSLDVFVLPSIDSFEAFGMVQLEAMKAGVPVIATDMRGVRVPIQSTGNGILVPPKDPVALANAIIEVLEKHPFDREAVSQSAWNKYPLELQVDRTLSLYRRLSQAKAA